MVKIRTAGGIVTQNNKILFILKRNKWDFPKGKIKQGNTKRETALIEVIEETGLEYNHLKIVKKLIPTYYYKLINNQKMLKKTSWYLIKYNGNSNKKLIPGINEEITECKWFKKSNLNPILTNTHTRIEYLLDFYLKS